MSKTRSTQKFHADRVISYAQVLFIGLLIWQVVTRVPILSGDTQALAASSQALVGCLSDGQFAGCPGALQFGITQYLPAMFLAWRGVEPYSIVVVLTLLNIFSFLGIVCVALKSLLVTRNYRTMFGVAIVGSPLLAYSAFSFSESLIGFMVILSLYYLVSGRRLGYIITTCLAISSRETAFISMSLLLFAMFLLSEKEKRLSLRVVVSGIVAGICTVVAFNYFKFGTWNNVIHSDPILRTSEIQQILQSLVGLLFSPNGGLVLFWPGAVAVLLMATIQLTRTRELHRDHQTVVVLVLMYLAMAIQLFGLASWYAPFGWVSWGPRLMIPTTLGALMVSIFLLDQSDIGRNVAKTSQRADPGGTMVVVLGAFGFVAALGFLEEPGSVLSWFGRTDSTCPTPAVIQLNPDYYFRCLNHGMWRMDGSILETSLTSFSGPVSGVSLGLFLFLARNGSAFRLPIRS